MEWQALAPGVGYEGSGGLRAADDVFLLGRELASPAAHRIPRGAGEREALYADLQPLVRRLIWKYGEDQEMKQDLAGEIFRRFCLLLDKYDPDRGIPLRPYLVRQLSASIYTFARAQWLQRRREVSLGPDLHHLDPTDSVDVTREWDQRLADREVLKALPRAISRLAPRQRQVVISRFYEERSYEEIAAALDVCPATARSLCRHALRNLRGYLVQSGMVSD